MELQNITSAANQILQLLNPNSATKRCIETPPMKARFRPMPVASPFPRATPESVGIPSAVLADYFRALNEDRALDMHSVTVIKNGAVVAEADFGAYDRSVWHISYSECKSVVGLAIGMLVDEGRLSLEDRVVKLLSDRAPKLSLITMKDLTVRHLLTMQSGAGFNESGSVTEEDWVKGYLESTSHFENGTKFNYNSMNTYMLSAIACKVSGESLTEYLRPRLWEPLDITQVYWETCPRGIEKGGWGLYMRQEDFAKIGQLVLNWGVWKGRRLISEEWLAAAAAPQSHPPEALGDYDYGYQIWCGRHHSSFLFSGMFGQNVLGFFDTGLLLVTNAGNDELFQSSSFFTHTHKYLGQDFADSLPEDPRAAAGLREYLASLAYHGAPAVKRGLLGLVSPLPSQEISRELDGRIYFVTSQNAPSVGLLPLMIQATQNIYTRGLKSVSFSAKTGSLVMTVHEEDASYALPIGFDAPERAELDFHGEWHNVAVTGRWAKNEDLLDVLIIRVSFLETAGARHIRIYFDPDLRSFTARWYETPGRPFITEGMDSLLSEVKLHPALSDFVEKQGREFALYKIRSSLEPEITGGERA